jgi:hypothetical protein
MKNKDTVRIKGHVSGTTGLLYQEIQRRQNQFLAALLDINEFRTSRVSIGLRRSHLLLINHYLNNRFVITVRRSIYIVRSLRMIHISMVYTGLQNLRYTLAT